MELGDWGLRERESENAYQVVYGVVLYNLLLFAGEVDFKKRMRLSEKQIVLFLFFFGAAWVFIRVVIFLI